MAVRLLLGIPALLALAPSCSINGYGIGVSRQEFTSSTECGRIVHIEGIGVHCLLESPFRSVNVGWLDAELYYPGPASRDSTTFASEHLAAAAGSGTALQAPAGADDHENDDRPVAITSRMAGLGTSLGSERYGLVLGFYQHAALRIPADRNGILFVRTRPTGSNQPACYVKEYGE